MVPSAIGCGAWLTTGFASIEGDDEEAEGDSEHAATLIIPSSRIATMAGDMPNLFITATSAPGPP